MKFPSTVAFEKHLKDAAPSHLAPIFLIVVPSDYERQQLMTTLIALLKPSRLVRMSGIDDGVQQVREELLSPSLWGGNTVVVYDNAEKAKGLDQLVLSLPPNTHLIVGSVSFKPVSELYLKGKKEVVALDLSDEKPWDKEKRVHSWIVARLKGAQKVVTSEAITYLLYSLGADIAHLDSEIEKLLCYVGERPNIGIADVKTICGTRELVTGWQLAEQLVWGRPVQLGSRAADLGFILPFIGQVRYQLQLGLQIAELLEKKVSLADLKHHFPSVRQIDKLIPLAQARKSGYFSDGLQRLYELEFAAKSSGVEIDTLFDYFQGRLYEKIILASQRSS